VRLSGEALTGLTTLWWLDVETGETQPVFQEENLPGSGPGWSPDGKWLSYVTSQDVRLYNLESGESHSINSTLAAAVDWSPDGSAVLYRDVVIQDGQFVTHLFVYDLASRTSTNITSGTGYENLFAAWSPDGEWIAAIRRDLSVPQGDQIWLMRADGSEARALTDQPDELHGNLNWSPDGMYLLYDLYLPRSSLAESDVQVIEVETGEITDLGIKGYKAKWLAP
jgi:TolB protein